MSSYNPSALAEAPDGRLTQFVRAAKRQRLVLYLGAGITMAPPSCGPTGPRVADALRPFVARILRTSADDLAGLSLEELAQRVADEEPQRLSDVRERAVAAFDFIGVAPNYGHEVVALLLREGLVEVISANWDCAVESAGRDAGVGIEGVADLAESIALAHNLPLYKVHGCAKRPWTLAVTQAEVDRPQSWAVGRTQAALAGGMVVFVGLGTVGLYVQEPFAELVAEWTAQTESVAVVDPGDLSKGWQAALGEESGQRAHIALTGDAFMDQLARALVCDALDDTEMLARRLAEHDSWAETLVLGIEALRSVLEKATAVDVLRWWRDGVTDTQAGRAFITDLRGQKSLVTVANLLGEQAGTISVSGTRGRFTIATSREYFEVMCRPGEHVSRIETVARDRIKRRGQESVYRTARPVTVVVADAVGEFPSHVAPIDISGGDVDPADIAAGMEARDFRLIAAEDGVRRKLAA